MPKILFVCPMFYSFELEIKSALERHGNTVVMAYEKPTCKNIYLQRLLQKAPHFFYGIIFDRYVRRVLSLTSEADFVVFIRGEHWRERHVRALRRVHKGARMIMYQWDFNNNLPYLDEQKNFFDEVYSFDVNDSRRFGFKCKPLFIRFSWWQRRASLAQFDSRYKVSFVGTDHSDRYAFIRSFCKVNGLKKRDVFFYLFRSRWSFYYNKFFNRKNGLIADFYDYESKPLSESESFRVFCESQAILDISQPGQAGLSARTFEALALGKKLITTNATIMEYDFYDPMMICVVDRENPVVPKSFWQEDVSCYDLAALDKYLIDNWVKDFFQ